MERRKNISTGSRRGSWRPDVTIFFTVGRATVCNRCAWRASSAFPRLSKFPPGTGTAVKCWAIVPAPASATADLSWHRRWKENLLQTRERFLEEYELADMLFVLSEKAADTFRVQGFPEEKLFYLPRGVDIERFKPGVRPPIFRAVFSGALIERKGIHHLLEAWHRLDLKDAELWLVGSVHEEARPHLKKYWRDNIKVVGFVRDVENYLSQGTVHVFPSQCEGSAKVTYEAAACGLPQITTREAGDVVTDGVEGILVSPGNVGELASAILELYRHPEMVERMGVAARRRVVENFTWDHFRDAAARRLRARDGDGALACLSCSCS